MFSNPFLRSVTSNIYQLLWNIENSNQLPQQLKHTRTKSYIYVIPEYRVPWLKIYKYPLERLFCVVPKGTLSVFRKE
jgi:hypothetical protein